MTFKNLNEKYINRINEPSNWNIIMCFSKTSFIFNITNCPLIGQISLLKLSSFDYAITENESILLKIDR